MTLSYTDIIITLVIVGVVLFAAHRLGQTNPIGTGKLSRRLSAVELNVAELKTKTDGMDKALSTLTVSVADVDRGVEAMRLEAAGDRGLNERTWYAVDRLQNFFLQDAFDRRRDGQ